MDVRVLRRRVFVRIEFGDLVLACDAEVYVAFGNEPGDIGRGQEDEGQGVVFDEGNVKAVMAVELDV